VAWSTPRTYRRATVLIKSFHPVIRNKIGRKTFIITTAPFTGVTIMPSRRHITLINSGFYFGYLHRPKIILFHFIFSRPCHLNWRFKLLRNDSRFRHKIGSPFSTKPTTHSMRLHINIHYIKASHICDSFGCRLRRLVTYDDGRFIGSHIGYTAKGFHTGMM